MQSSPKLLKEQELAASEALYESPVHVAEKQKARAALYSLLAAVFLTSVKVSVGLYTNSLAILSEALHSGLDLVAALMTWYAIRVSARPADRHHPYGHGKMENLSALAETVLLFIVCAYVGYEGVHRIMDGSSPVVPSLWGVGVMLLSMAIDINRVRHLRKVAKETNSEALEADALHFSTDILSSAVVFLGVLAVWLADVLKLPPELRALIHQADTVAALIVALIIFKVSLTMARRAVDFLLDAAPEDALEQIEKSVVQVEGVCSLDRLRMRSAGAGTFVDLSVAVDPHLRVSDGHRIASEVEAHVCSIVPGADVVVHVDPYNGAGSDQTTFGLIQSAARTHELDVHDVHILHESDGTEAAMAHVEFPGRTSFGRAYDRCKAFEADIAQKHPQVHLLTHIEPSASEQNAQVLDAEKDKLAGFVAERVQACCDREPLVFGMHALTLRRTADGLNVSFHCLISGILSVQEVHDITVRMEKSLREEIPLLDNILVHMEPQLPGEDARCHEPQGAAGQGAQSGQTAQAARG